MSPVEVLDSSPTMRESIRLVLEDRPPGIAVKLKQIGEDIIARSWMEDIAKDWHRLQMMASTMAKKGQLERAHTGYYRLSLTLKDLRPSLMGIDEEGRGNPETPPGTESG